MKGTFLGLMIILATFPIFTLVMFQIEKVLEKVRRFVKTIPVVGIFILFLVIPVFIGITISIYVGVLGKINKISRYLNESRFVFSTTVILVIVNFIYFLVNKITFIEYEWKNNKKPDIDTLFKIVRIESYNFFFAFSMIIPFLKLVLDISYFCKKKKVRTAWTNLKSKPKFSTPSHFMSQKELNSLSERGKIGLEGLYSEILAMVFLMVGFTFLVRPAPFLGLFSY